MFLKDGKIINVREKEDKWLEAQLEKTRQLLKKGDIVITYLPQYVHEDRLNKDNIKKPGMPVYPETEIIGDDGIPTRYRYCDKMPTKLDGRDKYSPTQIPFTGYTIFSKGDVEKACYFLFISKNNGEVYEVEDRDKSAKREINKYMDVSTIAMTFAEGSMDEDRVRIIAGSLNVVGSETEGINTLRADLIKKFVREYDKTPEAVMDQINTYKTGDKKADEDMEMRSVLQKAIDRRVVIHSDGLSRAWYWNDGDKDSPKQGEVIVKIYQNNFNSLLKRMKADENLYNHLKEKL